MGLFSRKKRRSTDDPSIDGIASPSPSAVTDTPDDNAAALAEFELLIDREWDRLANTGTWWSGGERTAIARDARLAAEGGDPSGVLPGPVEEAARRIAVEAAGIRSTDVARWESQGLDPFAYVEVTGIVSRLMALDMASFGLGRDLRDLPEPQTGELTRQKPEGAEITTGWAPTVGPASALSSLTAVPPEADALWDLAGVLYMPVEQMGQMQIVLNGLTRPQIELVAARTSYLNECFY